MSMNGLLRCFLTYKLLMKLLYELLEMTTVDDVESTSKYVINMEPMCIDTAVEFF